MTRFTIICFAALLATIAAKDTRCHHSGTNHYYAVGETYRPTGDCKEYTCLAGGVIDTKYCAGIRVTESCKRPDHDTSKSYPECCAKC